MSSKWEVKSTADTKKLQSVCDEIDAGSNGEGGIKLDPEYQREYKFTEKDESLLIESILMGIPIPVIYLSSDITKEPHVANVIDGQHRLRAVYRFLKDKFKLKGLEHLSDLNDSRFSELPKEIRNKLLFQSHLSFENIHVQNNPELEMEIFKRYNQGTHPLSKQEIRHAVYRSEFNIWFNKKIDNYFIDTKLKDIYNITKNRYADKSAHESLYVMLSILKDGLKEDFQTSPEYADHFMKVAAEQDNAEILIEYFQEKLEKVNQFYIKVYDELSIKHPLSKEIYGVQSKNQKLQTPILMIISSFLNWLLEKKVDILASKEFHVIVDVIREILKTSYLENSMYKGSNTRSALLNETSLKMIYKFQEVIKVD
ncbi:DUF262 domain-containing protein [Brevibacillus parabrevis]|jgi:Protein of unknown function DUF262.|uniref:DUF262 domain-containing protein n=1 Tax=Brevibacillus parabrevis TaxID=54914 RepID=UPI002492F5E3|nr:DUF262 domain-containing protein [Brevibacillus parabrevis]